MSDYHVHSTKTINFEVEGESIEEVLENMKKWIVENCTISRWVYYDEELGAVDPYHQIVYENGKKLL